MYKMNKSLPTLAMMATLSLWLQEPTYAATEWATGFIIGGPQGGGKRVELHFTLEERKTILAYGLGQTLQDRGLRNNVVTDPRMVLLRKNTDGSNTQVAANNDWQSGDTADDVAAILKALGVTLDPKEAAVALQLDPGQYIVRTQSADASSGNAAAGATSYDGKLPSGPEPGDITAGEWRGSAGNYDVCFNVSADGTSFTSKGSRCEAGDALVVAVSQMVGDCDDRDADVDWDDPPIPIRNNSFDLDITLPGGFFNDVEFAVEGTFSGDVLTGTVTKRIGSFSCTGEFIATPVQ